MAVGKKNCFSASILIDILGTCWFDLLNYLIPF